MVCRRLMLLYHEHPGRNATDHELLVSLNASRQLRKRVDPVKGPQPHRKIADRLLLSLQVGADGSRLVEANPALQTQLDRMRAHPIPERLPSPGAANTDPFGF